MTYYAVFRNLSFILKATWNINFKQKSDIFKLKYWKDHSEYGMRNDQGLIRVWIGHLDWRQRDLSGSYYNSNQVHCTCAN